MSKKFNLASIIDENVSKLDTFQIIKIKCSDIKVNTENFFEVSSIEELADSIDLIGLQQPLVVTKIDNGYVLIAGHRRFEAVKSLNWDTVPCIVSKPINNELEMLALIQTNTQTRELSYIERMEAVKRTEQALKSLKDKGYKFSGRLRDKISEITNESKTEIARMQAIEKNLAEEGKEMLEKGEISPSIAYEVQKMPKEKQNSFTKTFKSKDKKPTNKDLKQFINNQADVSETHKLPNIGLEWNSINEKPKSPCSIIIAEKHNDWEYKCLVIDNNFDNYVNMYNIEFWAEINPPM